MQRASANTLPGHARLCMQVRARLGTAPPVRLVLLVARFFLLWTATHCDTNPPCLRTPAWLVGSIAHIRRGSRLYQIRHIGLALCPAVEDLEHRAVAVPHTPDDFLRPAALQPLPPHPTRAYPYPLESSAACSVASLWLSPFSGFESLSLAGGTCELQKGSSDETDWRGSSRIHSCAGVRRLRVRSPGERTAACESA